MLRVAGSVSLTKVEEELVLLDGKTGLYYGLNASGTRMLEALERRGSIDGALCELVDERGVGRERLKADLGELVAALLARGLVEEEPIEAEGSDYGRGLAADSDIRIPTRRAR
jgi:hypothetical protein